MSNKANTNDDSLRESPRSLLFPLLMFGAGLFAGAVAATFALQHGNPWTGFRIEIQPVSPDNHLIQIDQIKRPRTMGGPVTESRTFGRLLVESGRSGSVTREDSRNNLLSAISMRPSRTFELEMPPSPTTGSLVMTCY